MSRRTCSCSCRPMLGTPTASLCLFRPCMVKLPFPVFNLIEIGGLFIF